MCSKQNHMITAVEFICYILPLPPSPLTWILQIICCCEHIKAENPLLCCAWVKGKMLRKSGPHLSLSRTSVATQLYSTWWYRYVWKRLISANIQPIKLPGTNYVTCCNCFTATPSTQRYKHCTLSIWVLCFDPLYSLNSINVITHHQHSHPSSTLN